MKLLIIIAILCLTSCTEEPVQDAKEQWPKERPGLVQKPNSDPATKKLNNNHALKGYQDNIQRAKDMEKEVLKAAERQRKAIDDT